MAYEVTRDLPLEPIDIETPLEPMRAEHLAGKKLCIVSILRAGNGIIGGDAGFGALGACRAYRAVSRSGHVCVPVEYYLKLPVISRSDWSSWWIRCWRREIQATAAATRLKQAGVNRDEVRLPDRCPGGACAASRPFTEAHPDVPVFVGAIVDRELDSHGYIRPTDLAMREIAFYGTK
jgi:uracil phosphoribosyltransferase